MRTGLWRPILVGTLLAAAAVPAWGFENFDKGKTPQQLFRSDCGICHRSAAGLGASMGPYELSRYLAEHYTASHEAAGALAGYLVSVRKEHPQTRRPKRRRRARSSDDGDGKAKHKKSPRRAAEPKSEAAPAAPYERDAPEVNVPSPPQKKPATPRRKPAANGPKSPGTKRT